MTSASLDVFKDHVAARGHVIDTAEWERIGDLFQPVNARRGEIVSDSAVIADELFFVCEGVIASIQTTPDGDTQIARFFESGHLCANITSAWSQAVSEDELIAMTGFRGLRIPFDMLRSAYLHGGPLDQFWRETILETLLFDKEIMCAKTIRDVGTRYNFLKERYRDVVSQVPDKHIARFLGITPQGLSRFLRNARKS
ncbi:MAG: hypothetical protein AAF251_13235 [Pseudomonadota bacterium]